MLVLLGIAAVALGAVAGSWCSGDPNRLWERPESRGTPAQQISLSGWGAHPPAQRAMLSASWLYARGGRAPGTEAIWSAILSTHPRAHLLQESGTYIRQHKAQVAPHRIHGQRQVGRDSP